MYNRLMAEKELNVKVGDIVNVQGNKGTVTEVFHTHDVEWNGEEYVKVEGSDTTSIQVHFIGELARWGQYQDGVYGCYTVLSHITKKDVLKYEEMFGTQAAIDYLTLAGPDKFEGTYGEYKDLLDALEERSTNE